MNIPVSFRCFIHSIFLICICFNTVYAGNGNHKGKDEWEKTLHGCIAIKGTNNVFTIQCTRDYLVRISLNNEPNQQSAVDYIVHMEDKKGDILYSQTDKNGSDGTTYLKSGPCHIPYTGKYKVIVNDHGSDDCAPSEKYTLVVQHYPDPDVNEPNNGSDNEDGMVLATPLQNQMPRKGMLSYTKDEDWYKIAAKKGQLIELEVKAIPYEKTIVDYEFGAYSNSGKRFFHRMIEGEKERLNHNLRLRVPEDGFAYFCVWDAFNDEYETTKAYTITASVIESPDSLEPNNGNNNLYSMSLATPLDTNIPREGIIDYLGDEDWFKIDCPPDSLIHFEMKTTDLSGGAVDYHWKICDSQENSLTSAISHEGHKGPFKAERTIYSVDGGTYYAALWDSFSDDFETAATYTITATVLPNPDKLEPNPNRAQATVLNSGSRLHGYIQSIGDRDVYRIDHKGGELTVEAVSDGVGDCPFGLSLEVLKDDNTSFCKLYNYGNLRGIITRTHTATVPAGTYYATVYDQGDDQWSHVKGYTIAHNTKAVSTTEPAIKSFRVSRPVLSQAGVVDLMWLVDNSTSTRLTRSDKPDFIDIPLSGKGQFFVDTSTTFTISAANDKGTSSQTAKVTLRGSLSSMVNPGTLHSLNNLTNHIGNSNLGGSQNAVVNTAVNTLPNNHPVIPLGGIDPLTLPPSPVPSSLNDNGPTPVVLVHGTLGAAKQMEPLAVYLESLSDKAGKKLYTCHSITLSKRGIVRGVEAYGQELKSFIDEYVPNPQKFHLIGYSQGALVARWYMEKLGGGKRVGKFISLCGTNHGTIAGILARIGAAIGVVSGAPMVLPCLAGTPQAATAVAVNVPAAGVAAGAAGGAIFQSIKDQDIGSQVLSTLYDAPKTAEYHAIWFSKDTVVTPSVSAMIQGAKNYEIANFRHMKAPKLPEVHKTIENILNGTMQVKGCQRIDLEDMIFFRFVRERDYKSLPQITLIDDINKVLEKKVIINNAEQGLNIAIRAASSRPDFTAIWNSLSKEPLFKKMQGKELKELYSILGPIGPVECAIARNSKLVIVNDVTSAGVKAASIEQRVRLLQILFNHKPILPPAREKMLAILEQTHSESVEDFREVVRLTGGADKFYSLVWLPEKRARLQKLLPQMKNCLRCHLSGKDGYIKSTTTKTVRTDCPNCVGGYKDCLICKGTGVIGKSKPCTDPRCSHGTLKCSWCKGTKKVGAFKCTNPVWKGTNHTKPCPKCDGDGVIEPKPCTNSRCGKDGAPRGKVQCLICGGKGYKETQKLVTDYVPCPNCKGAGEVPR